MKQLTINPNNKRFYSEDFIKGFKCGTQRQFEADKKDRPQGEVDAVEIYEKAESQLERNEITVGEFEKTVEPLRHLFYNRPQGWADKAISIIDDMQREGIIDYEQAREYRMRARMKGTDDESD